MTDLLSAAHEARRLAEEATPGPWRRGNGDFGGCVFSGNPAVYVARCGWPADDDQCYPNAGLIAHAGTHYGALAAAYIEAVGERDRRSAMSVEAFRQTCRDAVEETQQCGCDDGLGCYFNLPAKDRVRCSAEAWATAAEREYASAMDEITALRAALAEARTEAERLRVHAHCWQMHCYGMQDEEADTMQVEAAFHILAVRGYGITPPAAPANTNVSEISSSLTDTAAPVERGPDNEGGADADSPQ